MNTTMYLTDEFGISDQDAGWMYGVFGVLISVAGLLCGQLIDVLGVKTSLVVGACLNAFGRLLFATSRSTAAICLGLFVFMPVGMALGIPVMTIAIKRYSTEGTRTMAFGVYYSVMNLAALASGPVTDAARASFRDGVSVAGADFSAVRIVFLTAVASTALVAVVAAVALRDVPADAGKAEPEPGAERPSIAALLREATADPRFWRLMLFTGLMIGVRMVYRHLDATFPKYLTRELGKDAPYGTIYALNPLIVVVGVPIVSAFTAHMPTFTMIKIGSFVTAASVFILCLGASYTTAVLFVVVLSVGESLYSPRTYQFVMSVAPNGKEGTFTSLASAPMFVAKLGAGGLSGWLLQTFCPATGPRSSGTMWLLVGLISVLSPIGLVAFSSTIQPDGEDDGAERPDAVPTAGGPSERTGLLSTGTEDTTLAV